MAKKSGQTPAQRLKWIAAKLEAGQLHPNYLSAYKKLTGKTFKKGANHVTKGTKKKTKKTKTKA